jgi:adenylate cyclase class IV
VRAVDGRDGGRAVLSGKGRARARSARGAPGRAPDRGTGRTPPAARNIEVKVSVEDPGAIRAAVEALGARYQGATRQVDTYFGSAAGFRLKLREPRPGRTELIAYTRADRPGLRESRYRRWPVRQGAGLAAALALALGVRARVLKRRRLYLLGRTRIHLDAVDGLGHFVELEVVLAPGERAAGGRREAETLLRRLGLGAAPRIAGSYADLSSPCPPSRILRVSGDGTRGSGRG